jgi:2-hydroxy-6-oxonona-2,4-dienedioate hydrolase
MRIAYRDAGTGPETVVLVHGIGVGSAYLMPLARLLARRRRVIVPELPGTAHSERWPWPFGVPEAAEVLSALIGHLAGGTAPALVSNSLGCQVAIELAVREPARVGPLVLIGPTVDPAYRTFLRQGSRLALDLPREPPALWRIVARDYLLTGPRSLVEGSLRALADRPEERLPDVRSPVLVVRGEHDAVTTAVWARRCAALAPDGRFRPIPHAAHAPHFSRPAAVAELVEAFLAECGNDGREGCGGLEHGHMRGAGQDDEP